LAAAVGLLILLRQVPALALQPDEILLITNKNNPAGQKLADLYIQLRGVPKENQIALDLPDAEEMPFNIYETGVVAPTRKYLLQHHLDTKVRCLLTFYGVPFRIAARTLSSEDRQELASLKDLAHSLELQSADLATELETEAKSLDSSFKPRQGSDLADVMGRAQIAIAAINAKVTTLSDPAQKEAAFNALKDAILKLGGIAELDSRIGQSQRENPSLSPELRRQMEDLHQKALQGKAEIAALQQVRWDPVARAKLRGISRADFGLLGQMRVVSAQASYFATDSTVACTDNELALLWWDYYPRTRFLGNPLKYNSTAPTLHTLMTMRLDGPDPATVEKLMRTSVAVEKSGLQGIIAIDARGIQPRDDKGKVDSFGEFDEHLRHLDVIIRSRTSMKSRIDDEDLVFPPHFVKNVALYVGWYSVQHYIPGCDFNPGAIGYHVASYEMLTLHSPSTEWVRGLLTDGVVGTLGSVAEPYLIAFPLPDEFFPLLLTGKLTLAEVYWKTTPCTSWMIGFIGDPLYTPYRANPVMRPEDLPGQLGRALLETPANTSSTINSSAPPN
jgi:uncharacterized protein (TIGR03790 family)